MPTPAFPAIDHVVILVHDLEQASAALEAQGFRVLRRADSAEKPGSSFRFVSFDDGSYLLLNAFSSEALQRHRLGPVLSEAEGLGDWGIAVDDLDKAAAAGTASGVALGAEHAVRNILATGEAWGLRLLVAGRGSSGDPALPFLVQDTEGRAARIPGPVAHANGATGITAMTVASANPLASAVALSRLLALPAPDSPRLQIGQASVDFVPTNPEASGTRRMGGPVSVTLSAASGSALTLEKWPPR